MAESKGVWLDKDSGKIVKSRPARGRQLVAPGKEITAREQAIIDRYSQPVETAAARSEDVETATVDDKTVTTKTAKGK